MSTIFLLISILAYAQVAFCNPDHDIAVTDVKLSPKYYPDRCQVYQGWNVTINVTVTNLGNESETFDLTVYYDSTVAITKNDTALGIGETVELSFEFNTTVVSFGNYTIKAEVSILDDINMTNNVFTDGKLVVARFGDLDGGGLIDGGVVDIYDCVIFANAAGCGPESARWNALCDLDENGIIDVFDAILLAQEA